MISDFFDNENYDFSSIKQDIALKMQFINDNQVFGFTPDHSHQLSCYLLIGALKLNANL